MSTTPRTLTVKSSAMFMARAIPDLADPRRGYPASVAGRIESPDITDEDKTLIREALAVQFLAAAFPTLPAGVALAIAEGRGTWTVTDNGHTAIWTETVEGT